MEISSESSMKIILKGNLGGKKIEIKHWSMFKYSLLKERDDLELCCCAMNWLSLTFYDSIEF